MTRYLASHEYQYRTGNSPRTRSSGCVWTTASVGADAATGGRVDLAPDIVLSKVKPSEETSPSTPGWSLQDVDLAMSRIGVPFEIRSGLGWSGVKAARKAGLYVVLQGDSDRFVGGCSGKFDGDHCIGLPPDKVNERGEWAIDDPICPVLTYESEATLRAYATKFHPLVRFGVFTTPVPIELPDTGTGEPVGMKNTSKGPVLGSAEVITGDKDGGWRCWRVRDDASIPVKKGSKFVVRGLVVYHRSDKVPEGYVGYLISKDGEDHVLPSDRVSIFTLEGD